jgi:hypothetical protein
MNLPLMYRIGWSLLVPLILGLIAVVWASPRFNEVRSRLRDQDAEIRALTSSLHDMRAAEALRKEQESVWLHTVAEDWQEAVLKWEGSLDEARAAVKRSDSDLAELRERLESNLEQIEGLKDSVASQSTHMAGAAGPAPASLRQRILHPVFQIDGAESVGSAVLVWRGEDARGRYYLALTAQHVLRDLLGQADEEAAEAGLGVSAAQAIEADVDLSQIEIPCVFDQLEPEPVRVSARMVAENVLADLALLEIRTSEDLGQVARLAPRSALERVNSFTPIWTVGCPLGTTAQATRGEVTRTDWKVGSQPYWMVSSPAYFGNSGGGVFLADSLELVGVFSKIYTHGTYRPQVITHMGLAVPLDVLHEWLKEIGYGFLVPVE